MAKIIKNIDTVSHTYAGQTIEPSAQYSIQKAEESRWANSDDLILDIVANKAQVNDGISDIISISDQIDYLKSIDISPKDNDGSIIVRAKAAKTGWTYHLTGPEFATSTIGSLFHQDAAGNNLNETVVKFYDINNVELTTQLDCDTSCVKTVFYFEPPWDYEIIGGTIKTSDIVTENVRVWVIAVPDVPAINGGSKVMAQNINLKFIDPNNGIEADGRVSKFMPYSATYHTNKVQLIIKHPAGLKTDMMMAFELFRA